jgi:site-specific recombinase XerD
MWTQAVEAYLADHGPSSAAQYGSSLRVFERWYRETYHGEEPDPALLTREEVRQYRAYLLGQGRAAATINGHLAAIRGLAHSVGRRIEVDNVDAVEPPIEALNGRELGRMLAVVEGDGWMDERNVALVSTMVRAGLRVGEVVALDVDDVELDERSGRATVWKGKGEKQRQVRLGKQVRRDLAAYLEVRPEPPESRPSEDRSALFLSKTRRRLGARAVQAMVENAVRRAGIEKDVTPHTLRHTFATRFLRNGGDLAALRDQLGHASVATTNRYLHATGEEIQAAVEEL